MNVTVGELDGNLVTGTGFLSAPRRAEEVAAHRRGRYHAGMPVEADPSAPLVNDPIGILAILLLVLAGVFRLGATAPGARLFRVVPALVFCYFVPTALTTAGVIPAESELYGWVRGYLLPCSLLLLILALDIPAIVRLGPKAAVLFLTGTAGVMIGGPLAFLACSALLPDRIALPDDAWRGLAALSGSWIGGSGNMAAVGEAAEVGAELFGIMVIVDVTIANVWMGCLLYLAGQQRRIDAWTGADTRAIDELTRRVSEFQARTTRVPTLADVITIVALGFAATWASVLAGDWLAAEFRPAEGEPAISASTWKFIVVTAIGVALSCTPARRLEGAGASRLGSAMLYLLVACIGASADFAAIDLRAVGLLVAGAFWMLVHAATILTVGRLLRAPIFFVAVGSQANIGGAASAPVVAAAYHPALAPVGVLLAILGYVLGTYGGLVMMWILGRLAGAA